MATTNAMRAGAAYIELQARADRLLSDVQSAARQAGQQAGTTMTNSLSQRLSSAGSKLSAAGSTMTRTMTLPLVGIGAAVIKMGSDYEYQMARVKNISQANADDFKMLSDKAKELGASTQYSATQAAEGMEFLAMAGFKPKEIFEAMPAVLNGAAAANMDLGDTANIVSNIMTGFGLKATEATRATDLLTKASQMGNVDVMGLGESFKYGGSMAKMAGMSVEETAAAFTLMGNAGMQGSMGGTAVGAALRSMMKPSKFAQKEMDALGLSFQDANGKLKPLPDIIDAVGKSGATNEQFLRIFGTEGGRAISALAEQGSDAMRDLTKEIEASSGTTERFAADMGKTAKMGMNGLTSAIESLAISISESGVLDGFTKIVNKAAELVRGLSATNPAVLKWTFVLAGVTAAIGPLLKVGGLLFGWMGKIGPAITAVKTAMTGLNLAFLSSPVFWIAAAVVAVGIAFYEAYQHCEPFRKAVDKAMAGIKAAFDKVMVVLQPLIDKVKAVFAELVSGSGSVWDKLEPILTGIGDLFESVMSLIYSVVTTYIDLVMYVWDRWGDNILGMVSGVWGMASAVIEGALGIIQGLIKTVTSLITGDWSGAWEGIQLILSSVWDMIGGILSGALEYLQNLLSIAWDLISSVATSAWGKILDFFKGIPGKVVGFFTNWTLPGIIATHWQSIKDGTSRKAGEMLDYVKGLPGKIRDAFSGLGSLLWGKGQDLVRGLWEGIKSMGAWLRSTLMGWASSMIPGPIAKALGIHSPSTLMRDKIGKFIPAGVVEGVKLGAPAINRAMRNLVPTPTLPGIASFADDWAAPVKTLSREALPTIHMPKLKAAPQPQARVPQTPTTNPAASVTVNAHTDADPAEIGREVAWQLRTAGR